MLKTAKDSLIYIIFNASTQLTLFKPIQLYSLPYIEKLLLFDNVQ